MKNAASNEAYSSTRDLVHLPLMEQFQNEAEYYSTAFHSLTHSPDIEPFLTIFNFLQQPARFGSEDYSKEELVPKIWEVQTL